ncbi:dienelactone hydrolase [Povalibacter uvarum]|uniref:Dienelactone hydrolase n=1 Tax=Povalibacter uvarum TaxID=732238 RepID=A0A841HPJ9_9GAMM|nr:dienelactone hydrolase family protein [Povalibacter uvarum]MBB6094564.1 dienelactone hydrolase [Povalibacter uvarum]
MAIKEQVVEYKDGSVTCKGFLAYDDSRPGPLPGVLISHAWGGRQEPFEQKARDLARLGYAGFAIDVYGEGKTATAPPECSALMQPFVTDRPMLLRRLNAALTAASAQPQIDARRIAAMGYCFGGLCVLDLARSGANIRGVVSLHGALKPPPGPAPSKITAKVLVLHGHDDPMVPVEDVVALEKELTAAGADWQVHAYGRTQHAFSDPRANIPSMGLQYSADADRRSWTSLLNFFEEVLR